MTLYPSSSSVHVIGKRGEEYPRMNDKLDDIFANYEARKEQERKESIKKQDAENQARAACQERLERLILPTLKSFVDKVNAAVHQSEVTKHLEASVDPSVVFKFRRKGSMVDSYLDFRCADAGRISVSYELRPGGVSTRPGRSPSGSDPTPEWVEEKVLWFIEEALKHG